MEATIFTGWIYDHLLPHAEKVKVAHPLMLRAIAAAKRKNDQIAMENGKRHDNRAALVAGTQAQTIVAAILNVQTHGKHHFESRTSREQQRTDVSTDIRKIIRVVLESG